jgi:hypothetical protein
MTEIDTRTADLLDELLWLARHAQERIALNDPGDYWYVLGQRNTYARAAALTVARQLEEDSAHIAERIVDALTTDAIPDVQTLKAVALGNELLTSRGGALEWVSRTVFDARYGDVPGIDQDYGMRWGPNRDQRISLRRTSGAAEGMLYAYDPTWDEYALIQRRVPASTVGDVFLDALKRDEHLQVEEFARRLEASRDISTRALPAGLTPAVEP